MALISRTVSSVYCSHKTTSKSQHEWILSTAEKKAPTCRVSKWALANVLAVYRPNIGDDSVKTVAEMADVGRMLHCFEHFLPPTDQRTVLHSLCRSGDEHFRQAVMLK